MVVVSAAEVPLRFEELARLVESGTPVCIESGGHRLALNAASGAARPRREWKFDLHAGQIEVRADFDEAIGEEQFLRGEFE